LASKSETDKPVASFSGLNGRKIMGGKIFVFIDVSVKSFWTQQNFGGHCHQMAPATMTLVIDTSRVVKSIVFQRENF